MSKLKPNTSYSFSKEDYDFVIELAKVGHVHLLSNQINLTAFKYHSDNSSINFTELIGESKCHGLILPKDWLIEYIGCHDGKLSITFAVRRNNF